MGVGGCRNVKGGCGGLFSIFAFVEGSGKDPFKGFPFLPGGLFGKFELDFGAENGGGGGGRVDEGKERVEIVLEVGGVGEGEADGDL